MGNEVTGAEAKQGPLPVEQAPPGTEKGLLVLLPSHSPMNQYL